MEAIVIGAFAFAWVAGALLARPIAEAMLRWRMRRAGRFLPWTEVEGRLRAASGTIVYNRTNSVGRVWWSPAPVTSAGWLVDAREDAFLTQCPRRYRTKTDLLKVFPEARVVVLDGNYFFNAA